MNGKKYVIIKCVKTKNRSRSNPNNRYVNLNHKWFKLMVCRINELELDGVFSEKTLITI